MTRTGLAELQQRRAFECRLTPDRALELARRGGGVPARPRPADANRRLRAAEPLRRLPRGAVRAGQARLRPVAAHEVPVVRRARRARPRDPGDPPGQEPAGRARDRRGCSTRSAAPSSRSREDDPLLRHLAEAGPSELDDLQLELGLAPKELKRLRAPLERCGALVARSVVYEDPHRHTSELARWDQRFPEPARTAGSPTSSSRAVRRCRGRARAGAAALVPVVGGRARRAARLRGRLGGEPGGRAGWRRRDPRAAARGRGGGRAARARGQPAPVLTRARSGTRRAAAVERAAARSGCARGTARSSGTPWARFEWAAPDAGQGPLLDRRRPGQARPRDRRRALRRVERVPAPRGRGARDARGRRPGRRAFLRARGFEQRRPAGSRGSTSAAELAGAELPYPAAAARAAAPGARPVEQPVRDLRPARSTCRPTSRETELFRELATGRVRHPRRLGRVQLRRAGGRPPRLARVPHRRSGAGLGYNSMTATPRSTAAAGSPSWPRRPWCAGRAKPGSNGW